jgi:hypothetical protein
MEILWPALGICAIVCIVFFALAQHWQRLLRRHAWTVQRLTDRIHELEAMDNPDFRRRLGESAPVPLEHVYNFTIRFTDHFWKHTLAIAEEDLNFIRTHASVVGSIKLERWRSHTVATVTEILPASKTVQWQTRTLDFYPDASSGSEVLSLWQLSLARPDGTAMSPPSLELILRGRYLELTSHRISLGNGNGRLQATSRNGGENGSASAHDESLLLRVPLDSSRLSEFRSHDPLSNVENGNGQSGAGAGPANTNETSPGNWQAFYSNHDEDLGVDWNLWLRDLSKKAEWERWKIIETAAL